MQKELNLKGDVNQSRQYLEMRIQRLETDLAEANKQALIERQ